MATPAAATPQQKVLRLDPANHRYFQFQGKTTPLITSSEHYGAVLNEDFDGSAYLKELQHDDLNMTRVFSGSYIERDTSIPSLGYRNTLAPRPGRYLAPWARSSTPGYANGGNKFDLNRWDPAYFKRLKDFVSDADRRGIAVELVLFCNFYSDNQWSVSPMNAANNVNGVGDVTPDKAYDLTNPGLTQVQDALTRKLVTELNGFDNVYYEVVNEPYFGVPDDFQTHVAQTVTDTEAQLPNQHLIARGIANGSARVDNPDPNVSIFNFHYATPPTAVDVNADLGRAVADDETGFDGTGDDPYRREGWEFLLAGGSEYDNLDWSFTPGHEDGSDVPLDPATPGGGTPQLRQQLGALARFMAKLPVGDMHPDDTVVTGGVPATARVQALVEDGKAYGLYVNGDGVTSLQLSLPAGRYRARWVDTRTGDTVAGDKIRSTGAPTALAAPSYSQDIALSVMRTGGRGGH
ncbi:MAG TPA: hypothetical protein VI318_07320 [Baekduia sp.]